MSRKKNNKDGWQKAATRSAKISATISDTIQLNERKKSKRIDSGKVAAICIFLLVIVLAVFQQTFHFGFINFDDNDYVYDNPWVAGGLSINGTIWACTHTYADNWHPLTWLSLMADSQVFGLKAGGYHLTNVLLHAANAILLFVLLRKMTGFLWRSFVVAMLFAVHPLHVESVAWVAERKDVLSGLFFMLTLWAYAHYAQRSFSWLRYFAVSVGFVLGLMSKPMLVTLPFVLLLLDYWPLNRFEAYPDKPQFRIGRLSIPRRLILEKLPLLGLSILSCVVTVFAQRTAIQSIERLSLPLRLGNAVLSYVAYIWQMFWPMNLVPYYPYPFGSLRIWNVISALALLILVTAVVFKLRRRQPYLISGWLWYLIMLVPVIGIVQVGTQGHADRYTYLTQIGLYVLLTWAVTDCWRFGRASLGIITAGVIATFIACTWVQTSYWQNSEILWRHALTYEPNRHVADCYDSLGLALVKEGRVDDGIIDYERALAMNPNFVNAHNNLGNALIRKGQVDEAITHYKKALDLNPDLWIARNNLGNALLQTGRPAEALAQYQRALELNPQLVAAQNSLAWAMATGPEALLRNGARAVELAEQTDRITRGRNPEYVDTLAAAYAEAGRFDEAVRTEQRAIELAKMEGYNPLAADAEKRIKLYQSNQPFREKSTASPTNNENGSQ